LIVYTNSSTHPRAFRKKSQQTGREQAGPTSIQPSNRRLSSTHLLCSALFGFYTQPSDPRIHPPRACSPPAVRLRALV